MSTASCATAQDVPIVQPGAPGQTPRVISSQAAAEIVVARYTPADVLFMQDMIPHHNQAVQMAALVADRTNNQEILDLAGRIDASQEDEIEFMQRWLRERGERAPRPTEHDAMHTSHQMAGMASSEQMAALAAASSTDFDRLFLELMIPHHQGAVTMVEELHDQSGAAYDPILYEFTNDVVNDQNAEIERMTELLTGLSADPRAGLSPGFSDAGEAIWNLGRVASLPKPPGFFDPENPAGLPLLRPEDEDEASEDDAASDAEADGEHMHAEHDDAADEAADEAVAADAEAADAASDEEEVAADDPEGEEEDDEDERWSNRSPLLSFANTDMAFFQDKLVVGNYHGFNVYRLSENGAPQHVSSVVCPGGQGDVSIVGDLLIMSVEQTRGRVDCGLQGVTEDVSADRFRGLRIFDISDLSRPVQVGQVQTCRGSHTHSVVSGPGEDGKIIVYNSGTASVREEDELAGCVGGDPGDERTALFRIDVIEIPVEDPSQARIIDSPAVFADPETGRLGGLWLGGDHGDATQRTSRTDQCHDITVFPDAQIAAGACSGNGVIFDISDPRAPRRIDDVVDVGFAYWHSATFNNDGTKVIFTDEWGGGGRPRCRASDRRDWGADAFYDIVDGQLEFRNHFKLPAPQTEEENCVAHNGSIVPVPGRDIFVQAWYQGGLSVIDFTDSQNPVEIAFFDRGPIHEGRLVTGGYWSAYWYGGKIYGTEIVRGLDVFELLPSDYLSESEIAAAVLADQGEVFNPQRQLSVTWPAEPVVAQAYVDQLARDGSAPDDVVADLTGALDRAETALRAGGPDPALATELAGFTERLDLGDQDTVAANRATALNDTLTGIAARLR
ncbi:MAG: DUF305 domain-containing protein [Maricaulaceae bacterium]|jgi:uncharacterized protein (DUF305 family)